MNREKIYQEMKETLGLVPVMFTTIPDSTLELEWDLFKKLQLEEGPIPLKYRELIGLATAAVTRCKYCTVFHYEVAKLHGATDEEIEDAMHFTKASSGWSAYVNGMQVDYEQFKAEVKEIVQYVKNHKK